MAPFALASAEHPVGHRRCRCWLSDRPLVGECHRQRLRAGPGHGSERRRYGSRSHPRRNRLDDRYRRPELSVGQNRRDRALAATSRDELGPLFPHDRRPQGGRVAVRGWCARVSLHRWTLGHAHPHRAPESHQPCLRPGHLHRHSRRARDDHDDDGLLGCHWPSRELADPAHDRLATHGVPPGRSLLILDLHSRLPGHRRARSSSVGSRRGGPATPPCRRRQPEAWTPTWWVLRS